MNYLRNKLILLILHFIEWLQTQIHPYPNPSGDKIVDTIDVSKEGLKIWTDTGFEPLTHIHKTKPLSNHYIEVFGRRGYPKRSVMCADTHQLFDQHATAKFAKDFKAGDSIRVYGENVSTVKTSTPFPTTTHMYDCTVGSPNKRYYANGMLHHNTTTTAAFCVWYLLFHTDRNILAIANKNKTAIEIIDKITQIFKNLPFFMKPGIMHINQTGFTLDNGCQILSSPTTTSAAIGFTIHVLYMDEFAHIQANLVNDFWRSVYPTLSSSKISQCIITSTPNGVANKYFDIWDGAIRKLNSFIPVRVDWWEVPEHDEIWAEQQKADFGEEEFAQEFALQFNVSSKTLMRSRVMKFIDRIKKTYVNKEVSKSKILENEYTEFLTWHPNFDPDQTFKAYDRFVLTIDLGEGQIDGENKNPDYNVISIFRVVPRSLSKISNLSPRDYKIKNFFRLEQVGIYQDNTNTDIVCPLMAQDIVFNILGSENCKVLVEMNFNGNNFVNKFASHPDYFSNIFVKTYHTKPVPGERLTPRKIGYKTRTDREYFVKLGRDLITDKIVIISDSVSFNELNSFGRMKGKYQGISSKDDTCMANLNLSRLYEEKEYDVWLYDMFDDMVTDNCCVPFTNKVNELLELYETVSDTDDDEFEMYSGIGINASSPQNSFTTISSTINYRSPFPVDNNTHPIKYPNVFGDK